MFLNIFSGTIRKSRVRNRIVPCKIMRYNITGNAKTLFFAALTTCPVIHTLFNPIVTDLQSKVVNWKEWPVPPEKGGGLRGK